MRVGPLFCAPLAAVLCSHALAYPGPLPGTENIPKLMADSALVCKGEILEAPEVKFVSDPQPPRDTAIAIVHMDRCFKGARPANEMVPVLFDNMLPSSGGGPYVVLRKGDYNLFFLKPEADKFVLADSWFGHLSISRQLASPFAEDADPMHQLEMDFKAGLTDSDHERVLDSIRMLGNMRHLQSKVELFSLVNSPDTLLRTYIYEALLRLHDYSVLPVVEKWLMDQPLPPPSLLLPRDSLFHMQFQLVYELSTIRDPSTLPILHRMLSLPDPIMREEILQAVRAINSPESAPTLLKVLDDPYEDNGFIAMQALIELTGGGPIDWVPSFEQFRENRAYYAATCREWWQANHPQN